MRYSIIYSPDDGGYYGQIWSTETGKDLFITRVYRTREKAVQKVLKFIADNRQGD